MKKIILFISIFAFLSLSVFILLTSLKDSTIDNQLKKTTKDYIKNYNALYHQYMTLSDVIFKTNINTDRVLNIFKDAMISSSEEKKVIRAKLYLELKDTYSLLKEHNIKQLHFHLPNNESFLRFHRPSKYGDDLTDVRETIAYVNREKKPIDGFEDGRIYNGYRFVFPLFYNKKHIGSVEVSFSTSAMSSEFIHHYKQFSYFLILKNNIKSKIFKDEQLNYSSSSYNNFSIDVRELEKSKKTKIKLEPSKKTKKLIDNRWMQKESLSVYDDSLKKMITFIKVENPVTNRVIGIFTIRSDAQYIQSINNRYIEALVIMNLFIVIILFLIFKEMQYRKTINLNNKNLKNIVKQEVEKNRQKDKKLLEQSRLAQMGEMISMIAHQWRQPLGAISSSVISIQMKLLSGKLDLSDEKDREEFLEFMDTRHNKINEFVQSLSTTIDDFRNFFKPGRDKELFSLTSPILRAIKIVESSLISKNIEVTYFFECDDKVLMYQNELMQVILNILKNSEDNFIEKKIQNPSIKIKAFKKDNNCIISISDNGGGVSSEVLLKIFDPYFSTKDAKNGTGLGLYMSKIIVQEHHNGTLSAQNSKDGVEFKIILPITMKDRSLNG